MGNPEPPSPAKGPKEPVPAKADDLRSRLDALKAELGEVAREKAEEARSSTRSDGSAIGTGLRAGSELLAGVIVGCAIGYFLDRQFDLSPLFLIIFMMMGMAAGFWNVYRMSARTTRDGKPDRK
jgi:ATP synthase protein I